MDSEKHVTYYVANIYVAIGSFFPKRAFNLLFQESINKTKQKIYRKARTKIVPVRETSDVKAQQ